MIDMTTKRRIDEAIRESVAHRKAKNPGTRIFGTYYELVNGVLQGVHGDVSLHANLLPAEGILDCLGTWLGVTTKKAGWYIGLYADAINPQSGWTAATITSVANEIVSTAHGYDGANRPTFTPNSPAAGTIDNIGQEAAFAIATSNELIVEGAFLVSEQARGSTGGVLASAVRYDNSRKLQDTDDYRVGYKVSLTSS